MSGERMTDAAMAGRIDALLALDAAGALVPIKVCGLARELLEQAAVALRARPQAVAEGYAIAVPVGHLQCWENELNSAKSCIDGTLAWVSEYIKNHEDAKALLAASQSATGGAK